MWGFIIKSLDRCVKTGARQRMKGRGDKWVYECVRSVCAIPADVSRVSKEMSLYAQISFEEPRLDDGVILIEKIVTLPLDMNIVFFIVFF